MEGVRKRVMKRKADAKREEKVKRKEEKSELRRIITINQERFVLKIFNEKVLFLRFFVLRKK